MGRPVFLWYNYEHPHIGLAFMHPAMVHYGLAKVVQAALKVVLKMAYNDQPEHFPNRPPTAERPPTSSWINKPYTYLGSQETSAPEASLTRPEP